MERYLDGFLEFLKKGSLPIYFIEGQRDKPSLEELFPSTRALASSQRTFRGIFLRDRTDGKLSGGGILDPTGNLIVDGGFMDSGSLIIECHYKKDGIPCTYNLNKISREGIRTGEYIFGKTKQPTWARATLLSARYFDRLTLQRL